MVSWVVSPFSEVEGNRRFGGRAASIVRVEVFSSIKINQEKKSNFAIRCENVLFLVYCLDMSRSLPYT
jgi:hypothetical protein